MFVGACLVEVGKRMSPFLQVSSSFDSKNMTTNEVNGSRNESIIHPGLVVDCTQDGLPLLSLIFFES